MRVQIPAYTDRWMMGDRFGEVVKTEQRHHYVAHWLDGATSEGGHYKARARTESAAKKMRDVGLVGSVDVKATEIAHVKLDISGKTIRVLLDDCTVV